MLPSPLLRVTLSALALLSSYIPRVAAVSERTIGVGPFVSRPGTVEEQTGSGMGLAAGEDPAADGTADGRRTSGHSAEEGR